LKNFPVAVLLALCFVAVRLPEVRAAERGDAAAQYNLGEQGRDIAKDVGKDCAVDRELIALPSCAVRSERGRLRVIPKHVAALSFNKHGLAPALLTGTGWTYINRRGWVIVRDVAVFDNGASEFHRGLVRVTRDGKWGLADARGRLVVPLRYDGMLEYRPADGWGACEGCRTVQGDEHSWFEGGNWLRLNAQGKVIGPRIKSKIESKIESK